MKTKPARRPPAVAPLWKRAAKRAVKALPPARPAGTFVLHLFVAGATEKSRQAVLRVRQLCATELKGICTLDVIDIYQQPGLAREHQIVATPTLIVAFPEPMRRFIGNLKNITDLFISLDLLEKGTVPL